MHTKETYQKSRVKPAVVYWIHYLHQTNPEKEGYIGISTQLNKRVSAHINSNKHISNRIKKGAVVTILHETSSLEEAAAIEKKYRPEDNIGWNLIKGGDIPPSRKGLVPEINLLKGENRTKNQKDAAKKHSEKMKGKTPWNKGLVGKQIAWNKGLPNKKLSEIASTVHKCNYCGKIGKGSSMKRWHFENCKSKPPNN